MHRSAPAAAALVLLFAGLVVVGVGWTQPGADSADAASTSATRRVLHPTSATRRPDEPGRWETVLGRLLARRAAAYAAGEPSTLATVHMPGSPVLRRDVSVLRAWMRREMTVERAVVRVRTVDLVRRGPRSAVLRTVDRLGPAVAVGAGGAIRALPRDRPSEHRILLARTRGGWRIAAARALSG